MPEELEVLEELALHAPRDSAIAATIPAETTVRVFMCGSFSSGTFVLFDSREVQGLNQLASHENQEDQDRDDAER